MIFWVILFFVVWIFVVTAMAFSQFLIPQDLLKRIRVNAREMREKIWQLAEEDAEDIKKESLDPDSQDDPDSDQILVDGALSVQQIKRMRTLASLQCTEPMKAWKTSMCDLHEGKTCH